MKFFFDWKQSGHYAKGVLGPYDTAETAQTARDGTAERNPGDEVSAVYEADPATVWDAVPAVTARVVAGDGEYQVWTDGHTEVLGE